MADMQYIKRNGTLELERIQNGQDVLTKKKDVYAKIYQERMAIKNKKQSKYLDDKLCYDFFFI